jgi:hypothetical protein
MTKKLVLVFISLVVVIAYFNIGKLNKKHPAKVEQKQSLDSDVQILQNKKSSEINLKQAMTRLAIKQNLNAKALLIERFNSNDPSVNLAAAQSIGYFTDQESLKILIKRLPTANEDLRVAIFQSFGVRPMLGRKDLLEKATKSMNLSPREQFFRDLNLYKLEVTPQKKVIIANELVGIYQKNQHTKLGSQMLRNLLATVGRHQLLEERISNILQTGENQELIIISLRALRSQCPKDRYAYFKKYLSPQNNNPIIRDVALQELIYHPGEEADKIFANLEKKLVTPSTYQKVSAYFKGEKKQMNLCGTK